MQSSLSLEEDKSKLDVKLEKLLDQFEQEVKPLDRLSGVSMFATPAGIVMSIFLPLLYLQFVAQVNPFTEITSGGILYGIVGGIVATIGLTKLPHFYVDHKKHEISRVKYKPVTGVCMCDLYQFKSHTSRMDKATNAGERMRHAKLANYYKHQMGWS